MEKQVPNAEEDDEDVSKEPPDSVMEEKNNGESSSSSSTGKSDGGYSADCSATDQSSDDTAKPEAVSMQGLKLEDESTESDQKIPARKHRHRHRSSKETRDDNRSAMMSPTTLEGMEAILNRNMAVLLAKSLPPPQWNGLAISHPIDPRIDLSQVNALTSTAAAQAPSAPQQTSSDANHEAHTVESYLHLIEAVRPFFLAHGMPLHAPKPPPPTAQEPAQPKTCNETSEPSEGFTSFFTTTDSNNSNKTTTSPNSSDVGSKQKDNDDSSMVVLARAKRKHRKPEESSTSTSTDSREKRVNFQDQLEGNKTVPRIVTDNSSSNKTDSNATTSGSASGANSGSNNNSSGSGTGSGNDGKNSSEEVAEEQSDETKQEMEYTGTKSRERKLQDKKRKRIEMRREYEAQQFVDGSESSESVELFFKPGRPVTLDEVLVFSKIPRILVQGAPPFLVIHTNAAYCRLTGIDAHLVVGKAVNELLSVANEVSPRIEEQETKKDENGVEATPMELEIAEASGRAEAGREEKLELTLDRLIASSGFGELQVVQANRQAHKMLGKSVSVVNDSTQRDEESNNTSLTSRSDCNNDLLLDPVTCRISVAPVVSTSTVATMELDSHGKAKKLKLQTDTDVAKVPLGQIPPGVVTHFVLQLQPLIGTTGKRCGIESLSSKSADPNLLTEQQRDALAGNGEQFEQLQHDASASASETTEPVAAVG